MARPPQLDYDFEVASRHRRRPGEGRDGLRSLLAAARPCRRVPWRQRSTPSSTPGKCANRVADSRSRPGGPRGSLSSPLPSPRPGYAPRYRGTKAKRGVLIGAVASIAFGLPGCGGASTPPSVRTAIVTVGAVSRGGAVAMAVTLTDPDDAATATVHSDLDGSLSTSGDRMHMASGTTETGGRSETPYVRTTLLSPGPCSLVVVASDGADASVGSDVAVSNGGRTGSARGHNGLVGRRREA